MTSYTQALFAVATGAPMVDTVAIPEPTDPNIAGNAGNWLCCFWKEMAGRMREETDVFVPTRHGLDAVVDELFRHAVFQETLGNATDIIDHIALSYLPTAPPAFRSLWDHVIVPAWQHHATVHRLLTKST